MSSNKLCENKDEQREKKKRKTTRNQNNKQKESNKYQLSIGHNQYGQADSEKSE